MFEPDEDEVSRMAEDEVIQVGKNTKVSVLSQRLMQRFLEQGWIELEAILCLPSARTLAEIKAKEEKPAAI